MSSRWKRNGERTQFYPPSYCSNLNAIHEAWKTLDHNQRVRFSEELNQIVSALVKHADPDIVWFEGLTENATARQRVEAFLATML